MSLLAQQTTTASFASRFFWRLRLAALSTGRPATLALFALLYACSALQAGDIAPPPAANPFQDMLSDGSPGPGMVIVPAGSFVMGSPADEAGRYPNEGPQHRVHISQPFALGRSEVTVAQFKAFVAATGHRTNAEVGEGSFLREPESGHWTLRKTLNWRQDASGKPARDPYPVVHVSWEDARAYTDWLARESGQPYRLPSEAELEYANRAGSRTAFWWGDGPPKTAVANIKGEGDRAFTAASLWDHTADEEAYAFREGDTPRDFSGYRDGYGYPAPVASLQANPFGLHDTTGNVWEWAQDCWHDDYRGAPEDGGAWVTGGDCDKRVVRGGSWYCYPRHVRSANRWARWSIFRNMYIGFRVARDL